MPASAPDASSTTTAASSASEFLPREVPFYTLLDSIDSCSSLAGTELFHAVALTTACAAPPFSPTAARRRTSSCATGTLSSAATLTGRSARRAACCASTSMPGSTRRSTDLFPCFPHVVPLVFPPALLALSYSLPVRLRRSVGLCVQLWQHPDRALPVRTLSLPPCMRISRL